MDRNPFHFAHLDASDASLSGIAVAYEFHEACRDASTPPVLAILQTCLQNLKWSHILAMSSSRWICNLPTIIGNRFANHTATPKVVPADSLAERTELTPSRLFSSARRNCSRDGSYRQLPADGLQITPQCRSQPRWSRPLSPTTFVIVTNQKCQLYPCEVYHGLSAGMGRAALMTGCTTKDLCAASFRKPLVDNYLHSDTAHNTACGKRLVRMAVPRTAAPST